MNLKSICLIMLFISCSMPLCHGYFQPGGTDPRTGGMGEAFTALADDSNALFYNPAGLIQIETFQLSGMYAQYYAGLYPRLWNGSFDRTGYNIAAFALPIPDIGSTFGFGWKQFDTQFYKENAFVFGWGSSIGNLFFLGEDSLVDLGINVKVLRIDIDADLSDYPDVSNQKIGATLDLGLLYHYSEDLHIGLAVDNVIPVNMGLVEEELIKPIVRVGTAYYLPLEANWLDALVTSFELVIRDDLTNDIVEFKFGSEATLFDGLLALRAGLTEYRFTTGAGFRYAKELMPLGFQIDYAFSYPFHIVDTAGSHRIGMTINWNTEKINQIQKQNERLQRDRLIVKADDLITEMQKKQRDSHSLYLSEKQLFSQSDSLTQKGCASDIRKIEKQLESIKSIVEEAIELKLLMKDIDAKQDVSEMLELLPGLKHKVDLYVNNINTLLVTIGEIKNEVINRIQNQISVQIDADMIDFFKTNHGIAGLDESLEKALKKVAPSKEISLELMRSNDIGWTDMVLTMNRRHHEIMGKRKAFDKVLRLAFEPVKSNQYKVYVVEAENQLAKVEQLIGKQIAYMPEKGYEKELQAFLGATKLATNAHEMKDVDAVISGLVYGTLDGFVASGEMGNYNYFQENCIVVGEPYSIKVAWLYIKEQSSGSRTQMLDSIVDHLEKKFKLGSLLFEPSK